MESNSTTYGVAIHYSNGEKYLTIYSQVDELNPEPVFDLKIQNEDMVALICDTIRVMSDSDGHIVAVAEG